MTAMTASSEAFDRASKICGLLMPMVNLLFGYANAPDADLWADEDGAAVLHLGKTRRVVLTADEITQGSETYCPLFKSRVEAIAKGAA